jgi:hypothetical protein
MQRVFVRALHSPDAFSTGWIQAPDGVQHKLNLGFQPHPHGAVVATIHRGFGMVTEPTTFVTCTKSAASKAMRTQAAFRGHDIVWRSLVELKAECSLFTDDFFTNLVTLT